MKTLLLTTSFVLMAVTVFLATENYHLRQICAEYEVEQARWALDLVRLQAKVDSMRMTIHQLRRGDDQ